jgi:hypothetical protein
MTTFSTKRMKMMMTLRMKVMKRTKKMGKAKETRMIGTKTLAMNLLVRMNNLKTRKLQ